METLWYEGENRAADAFVLAVYEGVNYLLLVIRDSYELAFPGGYVEGNRAGINAADETARRETREETGLRIPRNVVGFQMARYSFRNEYEPTDKWVSTRLIGYDLGYVKGLPRVTAQNDPDKLIIGAGWYSFDEAPSLNWYADHGSIFMTVTTDPEVCVKSPVGYMS